MDYTRIGTSELMVSRIALGCMGFAGPGRPAPAWTLDEDAAGPIFRQAAELGVTFWDTANVYSSGTSEEIVGRAIRTYARRDQVVVATKVGMRVHGGATGSGLSRAAILEQADASLTRLGTDYVDLYQVHRFDPATPVEETMQALHEVVKAGKARYLGASSMWAWQFSKMQYTAQSHGWTGFVSMQDQYNLMEREEEREMFGLLADQNVSSIPWGPLGKGRLARPYRQQTARSEADPVGQRFVGHGDQPVIDAVQSVAQARGVPMAQVALAWVLSSPVVAAPIVGATSPAHLTDATVALGIKLTVTETDLLTQPYTPRAPSGFS
jgi:aryl-alcohol dehydrogenase-like predicted oxidoreductase